MNNHTFLKLTLSIEQSVITFYNSFTTITSCWLRNNIGALYVLSIIHINTELNSKEKPEFLPSEDSCLTLKSEKKCA